uniref:Uncharacterized protein n=1 Tax=Anopheles albimanus TaxID=7167 RepID=A0A182FYE1_ANOAL
MSDQAPPSRTSSACVLPEVVEQKRGAAPVDKPPSVYNPGNDHISCGDYWDADPQY